MFRTLSLVALFMGLAVATRPPPPPRTPVQVKLPVLREATAPVDNLALFEQNTVAKGADPSFLREAELKHGRLAMQATVILPTLELFTDDLGIYQFQNLPDIAQVGLVAMMFAGEFGSMFRNWKNPRDNLFTLKEDAQPGDMGFGLWDPTNPETLTQMDQELNHGRLAVIGALGMIVQELVTQQQLF